MISRRKNLPVLAIVSSKITLNNIKNQVTWNEICVSYIPEDLHSAFISFLSKNKKTCIHPRKRKSIRKGRSTNVDILLLLKVMASITHIPSNCYSRKTLKKMLAEHLVSVFLSYDYIIKGWVEKCKG
jgi:hypothetical protein